MNQKFALAHDFFRVIFFMFAHHMFRACQDVALSRGNAFCLHSILFGFEKNRTGLARISLRVCEHATSRVVCAIKETAHREGAPFSI